ncbi:MAG: hypothetical protein JW997_06595 [Actinobacteria bacterium]|nr:hypothetical protein [Actinomycetota bacterium]
MNNKLVKSIIASTILLFLLIPLMMVSTSCAKEPAFGTLTMCESVNPETKEPVDAKNEFDFNSEGIYASIAIENVSSEDSYRFVWKSLKDNTIAAEIPGKYLESEKRLITGHISSSLTLAEGKSALLPAGKYMVEFYHNEELKSSAEFTIKSPKAKIMQVSLAKSVDDNFAPVEPATVFEPSEKVNACIQIDYLVPGDTVQSKWIDQQGNTVMETPLNIDREYYDPSWIHFFLEGSEGNPMPAGEYKFEVYLNGELFGQYPFEIIAPHVAGKVTFEQNNQFTEAKDKYGFVISYPDSWQPSWEEDNTGITANFYPPLEEEALSLLMIVLNEGNYPTGEKDFEDFVYEIAESTRGTMKQVGDPVFTEKNLKDGTSYAELVFYFNDEQKGNFGLLLSIFLKNDKMYIWYGFAHESFYQSLNTAYYTAFNSIVFN